MTRPIAVALALSLVAAPAAAQVPTGQMGPLRPDQQRFHALFEELVETDTSLVTGDCTKAAQQLAARLRAAGLPEGNVTVFVEPDHPKEGSVVAVYPGTASTLKPVLLLGHIDVVTANRAD